MFVRQFQNAVIVTGDTSLESGLCESNDRTTHVRFEPVTKKIPLLRLGCTSEVYINIEKRIKKICLSEFENSMDQLKDQTLLNHQIRFFVSFKGQLIYISDS